MRRGCIFEWKALGDIDRERPAFDQGVEPIENLPVDGAVIADRLDAGPSDRSRLHPVRKGDPAAVPHGGDRRIETGAADRRQNCVEAFGSEGLDRLRKLVDLRVDDGVRAGRAVCSPRQERIESAGAASDLRGVHDTERHLFSVACPRARGFRHVSGIKPASEFLDDLHS